MASAGGSFTVIRRPAKAPMAPAVRGQSKGSEINVDAGAENAERKAVETGIHRCHSCGEPGADKTSAKGAEGYDDNGKFGIMGSDLTVAVAEGLEGLLSARVGA